MKRTCEIPALKSDLICSKATAGKEALADDEFGSGAIFPLGEPNDAFAKYFTGQSYLRIDLT